MDNDLCTNILLKLVITNEHDEILLLRGGCPLFWGLPSIHVNGIRGNREGVQQIINYAGISVGSLRLFRIYEYQNPCNLGGTWHEARIISARHISQTPKSGEWTSPTDIKALKENTEEYAARRNAQIDDFAFIYRAMKTDPYWAERERLSPVDCIVLEEFFSSSSPSLSSRTARLQA